jgi:serine protease AprX
MAFPFVSFRMRWVGAAAAAGALILIVVAAMAGGAEAHDKRPRDQLIVQMAAGVDPAEGRALVEETGGRVISEDLSLINGFGAELTTAEADALAADPRVAAVSPNGLMEAEGNRGHSRDRDRSRSSGRTRTYRPNRNCRGADAGTVSLAGYPTSREEDVADITSALETMKGSQHHSVAADRVWGRTTGKGVGVAVIDSGIAGDVPDFRRSAADRRSRVIATAVTNRCAREATDNYGHGTHVAGLIAGNGLNLRNEDPAYGKHMGIAPEANLISVKVADEDGRTTVLDVIHGLQFAVDNKHGLGIGVINLSLSSTVAESYKTDPLDAAVEQAWFSGIVVVAAAGNEGSSDDAVDYAPANDPYVITAGAVDDRGTRTISDDKLASWSSRGYTQDGFNKPNVLAPGASLTATLALGSDLQQRCRQCVTDHRYFRMGGTSMSSAIVSGVAALLLEEHPEWTPNQVKGALSRTLVNVPGTGGEVNVQRALAATNLRSNVGLKPSRLIDTDTGLIDFTRASFRRASFRLVEDSPLDALWSRASFRCECEGDWDYDGVDDSRASYRRASYRRASYRRASYRRASYRRASLREANFRRTVDFDK